MVKTRNVLRVINKASKYFFTFLIFLYPLLYLITSYFIYKWTHELNINSTIILQVGDKSTVLFEAYMFPAMFAVLWIKSTIINYLANTELFIIDDNKNPEVINTTNGNP